MTNTSEKTLLKLQRAIAANVRARREALGLSVSEAAERAGCSRMWWGQVESAQTVLRLDGLARLGLALEADPVELTTSV